MRESRRHSTAPALLALLTWMLTGTEARADRLTVPLSNPAKPAVVEVALVMGSIKVTAGTAKEVVIDARSRGEGGGDEGRGKHPGMQRIPNTALGLKAEEAANKVTIGADSHSRAVDLEIQVPAGSSLTLSTVNGGEIEVDGIDGEVDANNTNGGIAIRNVKGPVSANTINGDVTVVFRGPVAAAPMAFSTLNGTVDVTLPASLKANVRIRSDNGEIYSDFDIALDKNPSKLEEDRQKGHYRVVLAREMTGKIGGGGPEILFKTFNGDILLRRTKD
jgi:hypothetical protein